MRYKRVGAEVPRTVARYATRCASAAHFFRTGLAPGVVRAALLFAMIQGRPTRAIAAEGSGAPQPSTAAISSEELIATVLAGIAHNDELLGMVQAEVEDETLQPGVPETKRITYKTPDGGVFEYTMTPKAITHRRFIVHGRNVRQEHLEDDGRVSQLFVIRADRSIQYVPDSRIAWIRRPGDLANGQNLDPREIGNLEVKRSVEAIYREDSILEAGLVSRHSGKSVARILVQGPHSRRCLWELDPEYNFLPLSIVYYHDDGRSVNVATQLSYQQIPARSAWFLREAVQRIYGPGKTTIFDAAEWTVQTTSRVKKVVPLNQGQHGSAFDVEIPLGVEIRDNFTGDVYVLGQKRRGAFGPWTNGLAVLVAALVTCAVVMGAVRYVRSRLS